MSSRKKTPASPKPASEDVSDDEVSPVAVKKRAAPKKIAPPVQSDSDDDEYEGVKDDSSDDEEFEGVTDANDKEGARILSKQDNAYILSNSIYQIMLDMIQYDLGPDAVKKLVPLLMEPGRLKNHIEMLKMILVNKDDVLPTLNDNFDEDGKYVRALPVDVEMRPVLMTTKRLQMKSQSVLGLLSYGVSDVKFEILESEHVELDFEGFHNLIPNLNVSVNSIDQTVSRSQTVAALMGFINTNTDGAPRITDSTYSDMVSNLRSVDKRCSPLTWSGYDKLRKEVLPQYVSKNGYSKEFQSLVMSEVLPKVEKFLPFLDRMIDQFKEVNEGLLRTQPNEGFKVIPFSKKHLADARKFREIGKFGNACKDPFDFYSAKLSGLAVIKKFLRPVLDAAPYAAKFVAFGHSKTNNWEQLLNHVGCNVVPGNICAFNLEQEGNDRKEHVDFPIPKIDHPKFGLSAREEFGYITRYNDEGNRIAPEKKFNVVVSDVLVPMGNGDKDSEGKVPNIRILGANNEENIERFMEYLRCLRKFVDQNWLVIAKFVPSKTLLAGNNVWDWETYWPQYFKGCYVSVYNDARMHNGEVVLMIANEARVKNMRKFGSADFSALSRLQQLRMFWGNNVRNYLASLGHPVVAHVPTLSKFAVMVATPSMRKAWSRIVRNEDPQNTIVFDEEMEAENFALAEKKLQEKKANKELAKKKMKETKSTNAIAHTVGKSQNSVDKDQQNLMKLEKIARMMANPNSRGNRKKG